MERPKNILFLNLKKTCLGVFGLKVGELLLSTFSNITCKHALSEFMQVSALRSSLCYNWCLDPGSLGASGHRSIMDNILGGAAKIGGWGGNISYLRKVYKGVEDIAFAWSDCCNSVSTAIAVVTSATIIWNLTAAGLLPALLCQSKRYSIHINALKVKR
jgi:hypothetical protein